MSASRCIRHLRWRASGWGARAKTRARGFTLIEVLVALAIVAIGMAAVLEALTSSANTAIYLQDKTFAEWVALNRIETVRLAGSMPPVGTSNDNIDYAGRSWKWQETVTNAQMGNVLIPHVVQIRVDVRPADSDADDNRGWYASAIGFMGAAVASPAAPDLIPWSSTPNGGPPGGVVPTGTAGPPVTSGPP